MGTAVEAPTGAHFEFDEVKTAKGATSLGERPLLVWDGVSEAVAYFGEEGIKNILDGTSLRVSYQSIARRLAAAGKTDDEIAKAQVDFRPGKRVGGVSTPVSRVRNAAAKAAEKVSNPDSITALLEKINSGELTQEQIDTLLA